MAIRRVYVIWSHPLFHESVRALLKHPDIEWVGATADLVVARGQIASLRPDTVLVEEGESGVPPEALGILQVCSWKVRFVGLGLADNELRVYHGEQRRVRKADDLLHLIRGD